MNQVDAASQNSLRELNELNFARFDDKLERRLGELRAELRAELGELHAELQGRGIANLQATLSAQLVSQMRWMVGILAAVFLAVMGLWFRH